MSGDIKINQSFAPACSGTHVKDESIQAVDERTSQVSTRYFDMPQGMPVICTPKPSVISPSPEPRQQPKTDERIARTFIRCFECIWQNAPIPLLGYYLDQFRRSEGVFQNLLQAKESFNAALRDSYPREHTEKLYHQFLEAIDDMHKETKEMYARVAQLRIDNPQIFFRKHLRDRECERLTQMYNTDRYHPEFICSLSELLSTLEQFEFITPEDRQLYQIHNVPII